MLITAIISIVGLLLGQLSSPFGPRISAYNAQAVVDSEDQIIVAAETTNAANDKEQAVPMAQAALNNLDAAGIERPKGADGTPTPIPNTADTGYFSEKAVEGLEKIAIDPHIAVGRQEHHETPVAPQGQRPLKRCSGKDFQQEVFVPTTTAAFHGKAVAVGMLLQE